MSEEKNPLVSIVTSCYNHENYVQECIKGIIAQDYDNIEYIIIDDGSKDNSVEKIREMEEACKNRFVRFEFRHRENRGLCASLNEGISWCRGDYLISIASDDIMLPERVKRQVAIFEERDDDIVAICGNMQYIDENSELTGQTAKRGMKIYDFNDVFLHNNWIKTPTIMTTLESRLSAGLYPSEFVIEDWYMWLKITENSKKILFVDDYFVKYRVLSTSLSRSSDKMFKGRGQILDYYKTYPLYKHAKSICMLASARDYFVNDKKKSLILLFTSLSSNPIIILNLFYLRCLTITLLEFTKKMKCKKD